jgi:ACR3 family arsenite transporter
MILGVGVGYASNDAQDALDSVHITTVSLPLAFGLWFMMYPVLVKVKYEAFPAIFRKKQIWIQIGFSLLANWIIGPFIMLGIAWATLPDLSYYRNGVIMVGLARCIAMVLIWNTLAQGDPEYCAILVSINSILQIILYAPLALFFLVVISHQYTGDGESFGLDYWDVFRSVLLFLGVPLAAAILSRYGLLFVFGKEWFEKKFAPVISPVALIALLWTIFVIFTIQGPNIINNIGNVVRVAVPMVIYFIVMFMSSLFLCRYMNFGYENAVTQAFTASNNNFELAIAVAAATFGVNSPEALAATIGPLVEVPALLSLVYVSLWLKNFIPWPVTAKDQKNIAINNDVELERCR